MRRQKNYLLQRRTFYVLQKGHCDQPFFIDEACFHFYLNRLLNSLRAYRHQLHTYVLLPSEGGFLKIASLNLVGMIEWNRLFGQSIAKQIKAEIDSLEGIVFIII